MVDRAQLEQGNPKNMGSIRPTDQGQAAQLSAMGAGEQGQGLALRLAEAVSKKEDHVLVIFRVGAKILHLGSKKKSGRF